MTLRKFLTGKPGNIKELIRTAIQKGLDSISVEYFATNRDSNGFGSIHAGIIYHADGTKLIKKWNPKYGPMFEGREKESIIESLKNQATKTLTAISNAGLSCNEKIEINDSYGEWK